MSALVPAAGPPVPAAILRQAGREHEVSFICDDATFKLASGLALLGEAAPGPSYRRLQTIYFDTEDGRLRARRMALRLRRTRGGYLMGLKWSPTSPAHSFARGEVEVMVRSPEPDLSLFGEDVRTELGGVLDGAALVPVFATDIRRSVKIVGVGRSAIEVAFDSGNIRAGDRHMPVRDIELELKSGDASDLFRLGLALLDRLPLRLGTRSKAERGAWLLTGVPPGPVGATAPAITSATNADDAIAGVIRACLIQFTANWECFRQGERVEAVHQMRVAIRRLRSALAIFNRTLPCPEFVEFRAEARRLASVMGEARDWDVFGDLVRAGPLAAFPADQGLHVLLQQATARAEAGHRQVEALLADPGTSRFVLALELFVVRRGWRVGDDAGRLAILAAPVGVLASECLGQLDRKARKQGKHFDAMSEEERHELRIRLKNVRYAAGFFGHVFDQGRSAREFGKRVAYLQDLLGHLNDATVAGELLQMSGARDDPETAYAAGIMSGWYRRAVGDHERELRRAWVKFQEAPRFWRSRRPERSARRKDSG
jgi:inorganic triphosphatase YgiF